MGYLTYYTFNCYDRYSNEQDVSSETELGKQLTLALADINSGYFDDEVDLTNFFYESMKWYDHDVDMIELSKRFPNYTFILEGEGEENGDLWRTIYHDGQMETLRAKITYEMPQSDFAQIVYDIYNDVEE